MSTTASANAVTANRNDVRRAAAPAFSMRRLWHRLGATRASRTDRQIAELLHALGHDGVLADFEQARSNR